MFLAPPLYVSAPPVTPARYGLLDAADLVVERDTKFRNGIEYQTINTPAKLAAVECLPLGDEDTERDAAGALDLVTARPIIVYAGFTCKTVGLSESQLSTYARDALSGGESTAVEKAIWGPTQYPFTPDAEDFGPYLLDANTEILSSSGVSLTAAVSLLEEKLGDDYKGVGVIHAPRGVSAFAAEKQQVRWEAGKPVTTVGTRWSFGNYPRIDDEGAAAADGSAWVVATGKVTIRRTEPVVRGGDWATAVDVKTNEVLALAERTYVVAIEGPVAAVLVNNLT